MSLALKEITMSPEQIDLLKRTICRGCSDDEMKLFLYTCTRLGLDPFLKQIYAIKRGGAMTIQISIDGYRLIAEKTKQYVPGREPSFQYDKDGKLMCATAYVKKLAEDGSWHEVCATAFMAEYAVTTNTAFWGKMPHNQLAKCAESLALRRAFPAQLAGTYTQEEMEAAAIVVDPSKEKATEDDVSAFQVLYQAIPDNIRKIVDDGMSRQKVTDPKDLTAEMCLKFTAYMDKEFAKGKPKELELGI